MPARSSPNALVASQQSHILLGYFPLSTLFRSKIQPFLTEIPESIVEQRRLFPYPIVITGPRSEDLQLSRCLRHRQSLSSGCHYRPMLWRLVFVQRHQLSLQKMQGPGQLRCPSPCRSREGQSSLEACKNLPRI